MAIKKTNKAPENKATFFDVATAINHSKELQNGNGMQFALNESESAKLTIIENDNGAIVFLSLFNVSIFGNVRKTGAGAYFVSFPAFKKQDGTYFDYVTCYNKELNALLKGIVNEYMS